MKNKTSKTAKPRPLNKHGVGSSGHVVTVTEQNIDTSLDILRINNVAFLREEYVEKKLLMFLKQLINEGKIKIVKGHESYFNLG